MAERVLQLRSGLEEAVRPGRHGRGDGSPGTTLALPTDLKLVSVLARRGGGPDLNQIARDSFGCALPFAPAAGLGRDIAFLWSGPGQWLARAERRCEPDLIAVLRASFGRQASVVEQSDGRTTVQLAGTKARDALAKFCPIDLHPRAFRAGDAALTHLAHVSALLWQIDEQPTYEMIVHRSFALSFLEAILLACGEFGCEVMASTPGKF